MINNFVGAFDEPIGICLQNSSYRGRGISESVQEDVPGAGQTVRLYDGGDR